MTGAAVAKTPHPEVEGPHAWAETRDRYPRDQDGSAKVALLGIDRSILAWALFSQLEAFTSTALPAMLTLDRLRRNVEKAFPKARPFVRPGFDTLRFK